MRRRRHRQKRKQEKHILFIQTEGPVIPTKESETKKTTKENQSDIWGNAAKVASVIAWYVNPAIYILFSVAYFAFGVAIPK